MNQKEFEELYTEMRAKEQDLLGMKRQEYIQGDEDVLLNFKQSAAFIGCDPMDVCVAYLMKHIQSVVITVKESNDLKFVWENSDGSEGLAQRFSDARNYLALLAGLIVDQAAKPKLIYFPVCEDVEKVLKFSGDKPKMGNYVYMLNDGTVSKFISGVQTIIGCRIPTLCTLNDDEIFVKVYGGIECE